MNGTLERFTTSIVVAPNGCWLWTKGLIHGYAAIHDSRVRRSVRAARYSYGTFNGPIPLNKEIDHLCREKRCVNPSHLEAVTHTENVQRGVSPTAMNRRKTTCKRGHQFNESNTIIMPRGRACKTCHNAGNRAYKARMRAQRSAQ